MAIKLLRGASAHDQELLEGTTKVRKQAMCSTIAILKSKQELNKRGLEWVNLNHDNILKFHGILYEMGSLPAMVTPYCDNGNVLEYMKKAQPEFAAILLIVSVIFFLYIPFSQAGFQNLGIACGLEYLHFMNVVHGDLRAVSPCSTFIKIKQLNSARKQANIMIDNKQQPVIADFGLTFVIDHGAFTTNKIAGPARWTAPEILDPPGEHEDVPPYSHASDVFAFGMTMIEVRPFLSINYPYLIIRCQILTGKPPYNKIRNDSAVIFKIIKGERPEIPDAVAKVQDVQDLLISTWEEHPENRPSASEIRLVLERNVEGVAWKARI